MVSPHRIKYLIYENIYDGVTDHDYFHFISGCVNHLKLMKYIEFRKVEEKWVIYIKK